jgi:hypothetical protein
VFVFRAAFHWREQQTGEITADSEFQDFFQYTNRDNDETHGAAAFQGALPNVNPEIAAKLMSERDAGGRRQSRRSATNIESAPELFSPQRAAG